MYSYQVLLVQNISWDSVCHHAHSSLGLFVFEKTFEIEKCNKVRFRRVQDVTKHGELRHVGSDNQISIAFQTSGNAVPNYALA